MAEWYRASTSASVDLGSIPSRVKPMTKKLVFTACQLDVQHLRESRQSLLVYLLCRWKKHLTEFPHLSVVDRWLATPKRAPTALRRFRMIGG